MFNNHWLEEQLNHEHRRELEQRAEDARVTQSDRKPSAWEWLEKRLR